MDKAVDPPSGPPTERSELDPVDITLSNEFRRIEIAQRIVVVRKLRAGEFSSKIFGEPGWDILLELYIREESGRAAWLEDLQQATGVPSSVVSRWLTVLQSEGLISFDKHVVGDVNGSFELTPQGRQKFERYLDSIKAHVVHPQS